MTSFSLPVLTECSDEQSIQPPIYILQVISQYCPQSLTSNFVSVFIKSYSSASRVSYVNYTYF